MDIFGVSLLVIASVILGFVVAWYNTSKTTSISLNLSPSNSGERDLLASHTESVSPEERKQIQEQVVFISDAISAGANGFLHAEYRYIGIFVLGFSVILGLLLGFGDKSFKRAIYTVIAFVLGSGTSILSGWIGMKIAVIANSRVAVTAFNCSPSNFGPPFLTAFRAGAVMGFALVALALANLYILIEVYYQFFDNNDQDSVKLMYECIAGYGLGGSSVALFGRVGGGIYTKAADVGADMFKIERDLKEDSPRNPAVIADNVGDNVGDIAGMGADLFGSFAEGSCAAMVIASASESLFENKPAMVFPLILAAMGIFACFITSLFATWFKPVEKRKDVEPALKYQLIISTVLMTPLIFVSCLIAFPESFVLNGVAGEVKNWHIFFCVACGLWSGLIIGLTTEYYTSNSYGPVKEVADASVTGAATNIIYGLALGYKSVIVPIFCMALTIYVSHSLAGMYGIAVAALGILSTLSTGLTIDAYGPICDNGGGIAEMAEMPKSVRDKTDCLDAAGNTTAAIGKGFAIGSAALVSLALFGAFVTTVGDQLAQVDILQPLQFSGLLVGAMLPYWFTAMTMKSVGEAAKEMIVEVRRQFDTLNLLDENCTTPPDYNACVEISTEASLREMIPPGCLVMLTPLITGYLFGVEALAGLLAGALTSGVQMAISQSNTGGAWDNAKKYVETGALGPDKGKGSPVHVATVIGDTVGDPLKDTSGPAINILIKLSAITSVVFASSFPDGDGYLIRLFN